MKSLPTGTVTFLFTDIEGSTRLLEQLKDAYADVLVDCRELVRTAVQERGGQEVDTEGDAIFAAFPSAREALLAVVAAQQGILRHPWPDGAAVKVRMGLHTGEARVAEGGYVGMDVHRAARICASAHGGQILVSDVTQGLVTRDLPDGVTLRDLGEHRLKDLAHRHRLFQVVAAELPVDFPPIRSLDALPNNLPRQLTSFIGREKEMAEVKRLLSTAYLVTLTGSGGAGKTRLALQVAADVVEGYPDGVWLAELAPITDPVLVPKTVASALNVPEQPSRDMTETLVDALRPKTLLLVLDNCEHLLAACRDLTATLLRTCPQVRVLATSREGLGVPGDTLWPVPPLAMPEEVRHLPPLEKLVLYEAVRLFVDRAVAVAPRFAVTNENAHAVTQVCYRLDGIPLAIELAAARVKILTVEQIAARLDDRFRLLTGGSQVLLPRQQTLRATLDWSYDLLSEHEQILLRKLSVFAGGFTLEAAEQICAGEGIEEVEVLDLLGRLVDKSLVVFDEGSTQARYRLLETVRQYGAEKLQDAGEAPDVRRRHRDWFLARAEDATRHYRGPEEEPWLRVLEEEHENLRSALAWTSAQADGAEAELRLVVALRWFWFALGYWSEGRAWSERAITHRPETTDPMWAGALLGAALFASMQGDYVKAIERGERSIAICHEVGDREGCAVALGWLGGAFMRRGDYGRGQGLLENSLSIARDLDDKWLTGTALARLGVALRLQGQGSKAVDLLEESLSVLAMVGHKRRTAYALCHLGGALLPQHDYSQAAQHLSKSLAICRQLGDEWIAHYALQGMAEVAHAYGRHEEAALLLGATEALRERLGHSRFPADQAAFEACVVGTRASLGDASFAAAWAEGRAMTLEQAIEYALGAETD